MSCRFLMNVILALVLAVFADPGRALGDDLDDFLRLSEECKKQSDAGEFDRAEKTALALQRLADGALAELPLARLGAARTLGTIYFRQRRYDEAEPVLKRALAISKEAFGNDEMAVGACLNSLALVYHSQGRYDDAKPLYEQSLAIAEKQLGKTHPSVAAALGSLAELHSEQGRLSDAEPMLERALAINEQTLGKDHPQTALSLHNLAKLHEKQGHFAEAEPLHRRALSILEKALGEDHPYLATSLTSLANMYCAQQRFTEAEPLLKRALTISEAAFGRDNPGVASALNSLALLYQSQGRYDEAKAFHERALAIAKKTFDENHPNVATSLDSLAGLYHKQRRYSEAEPLYKQALAIREKAFGPDHSDVGRSLDNLASLYADLGRYAEAQPLYERALAIKEEALGADHPSVATSLNNLALLLAERANYAEAEQLFDRSIAIQEKCYGSDGLGVLTTLNNRATLCVDQGRYAEAEGLYRRALAIVEENVTNDHPAVVSCLNYLAVLYRLQGRSSEAKELFLRALAIQKKLFGEDSCESAETLGNLAGLYSKQGRYAEAEPLFLRAIAIQEKFLGKEHIQLAMNLENLALLYYNQGRFEDAVLLVKRSLAIREKLFDGTHPSVADSLGSMAVLLSTVNADTEAERLYQRSLELHESVLGPSHPRVAEGLVNLAGLYVKQERFAEAEPLLRRSLKLWEESFGPEHPNVAQSLISLVDLHLKQGRGRDAEPLADRAVAITNREGIAEGERAASYARRAEARWALEKREDAVADLREAMRLATRIRRQASGIEQQRSGAFAMHLHLFERMVFWQTELHDFDKALEAMEQSRAQGLQDLMRANGVDMLEGLPEETASRLNKAEGLAQADVVSLQKRFKTLQDRTDMESDEKAEEGKRLLEELAAARERLVQAWSNIKNASPAYRLLLAEDRQPVRIETMGKELAESDTLALQYLLGSEHGFLLAYGGGIEPILVELKLNDTQASLLNSEAGPLTAIRAREILFGQRDRDGLLHGLTSHEAIGEDAGPDSGTVDQLNVLWTVLIPDERLREQLVDGETFRRLLIIPDGALARLPFETLVVDGHRVDPTYLLDAGPPTMYAPSATVFHNLKHREVSASKGETLTVGDPSYGSTDESGDRGTVPGELEIASRFAQLGRLADLPWTGDESCWIKESCEDKHVPVVQFTKEKATEENVRNSIRGRSLVHFACHGLADDECGNLFGALAFTPVDAGNPSNDGFLTVAEMFDLDLHACELAILSACDTNIGPNQRGEGTWSMCRGMLTSGARRVVTTDWQVADEASAHLVYAFVYYLHECESGEPDYTECLRDARLSIRNHDNRQWRHPYFWAPFVLMGPE